MLALGLAVLLALALAGAPRAGASVSLAYDRASADAIVQGTAGTARVIRPAIVQDEPLRTMSAPEIALTLRAEIDAERPAGVTPHVVAIDEIGNAFRDPAPVTTFTTVSVRGKQYRIASHNRIRVTEDGWDLVRSTPEPPAPEPTDPGPRLAEAMGILAAWPAPWGGTYADRVHLLIAPAMVTSIGVGRGEHFTLDRTGSRQIRRAWRGVMPALTRAGGVWMQMYHGGRAPLSMRQWRRAPGRLADYMARNGGDPARLHLLITAVTGIPAGMTGCADPMGCQWSAALSSELTRAVIANGVGAYRLEGQAPGFINGLRSSLL